MRPPKEFDFANDVRYLIRFGLHDSDEFVNVWVITRLGAAKAVVIGANRIRDLSPGSKIVLVDVLSVEEDFDEDFARDIPDYSSGYVR